jgi:hypothetical protein
LPLEDIDRVIVAPPEKLPGSETTVEVTEPEPDDGSDTA